MVTFTIYPPMIQDGLTWRKMLVGTIFTSICILGILAVFFPKECSRGISGRARESGKLGSSQKKVDNARKTSIFTLVIVHGHHPGCRPFSKHEFQIGGKTFCVGCMGLFLGAAITLAATLAYFFAGYIIEQNAVMILFTGILGVVLGLLQPLFNIQLKTLRFFLNVYFVIGMLFILVGADILLQSTTIDLFIILLSVFWIFTRIFLSRRNHERICESCGNICVKENY
jgi:type III secretory pathway component EscS